MNARWTLCLGILLGLGSCATPKVAEFKAPPLETQLSYFEGSIRSGPVLRANAPVRRADEALSVEFSLRFFEHLPCSSLTALPERIELVMVARGGELLQPTSELGRRARIGSGESAQRLLQGQAADEYGRSAVAAQAVGALSRGVTSVFSSRYPEALSVPGEGPAQRRFALQLARAQAPSDDELSIALVIEDLAALVDEERDDAAGSTPGSRVLQREYVLIADHPRVGETPIVLGLPTPVFGADSGFALWIDVRQPPAQGELASAHESAFAQAELELTKAEAEVGALSSELPQSDLYLREVGEVFQVLDLQRYHRSALVFLAGSTQARLAQDIALVAEQDVLAAYVQTVIEQSKQREVHINDAPAVGWLLERSAYLFAAARMEAAQLPQELRACLLAHAGEVGRSGGGLQSAVAESTDLASFEARLLEDNWISLEDTQPAARVRAFDWLRQRGQAPAGFDPLGSREARRASLHLAIEAKESTDPAR